MKRILKKYKNKLQFKYYNNVTNSVDCLLGFSITSDVWNKIYILTYIKHEIENIKILIQIEMLNSNRNVKL